MSFKFSARPSADIAVWLLKSIEKMIDKKKNKSKMELHAIYRKALCHFNCLLCHWSVDFEFLTQKTTIAPAHEPNSYFKPNNWQNSEKWKQHSVWKKNLVACDTGIDNCISNAKVLSQAGFFFHFSEFWHFFCLKWLFRLMHRGYRPFFV